VGSAPSLAARGEDEDVRGLREGEEVEGWREGGREEVDV